MNHFSQSQNQSMLLRKLLNSPSSKLREFKHTSESLTHNIISTLNLLKIQYWDTEVFRLRRVTVLREYNLPGREWLAFLLTTQVGTRNTWRTGNKMYKKLCVQWNNPYTYALLLNLDDERKCNFFHKALKYYKALGLVKLIQKADK